MSVADQWTASTFVLSRFKKSYKANRHMCSASLALQYPRWDMLHQEAIDASSLFFPKYQNLNDCHGNIGIAITIQGRIQREASKQIARVNISQSRAEHLRSFLVAILATGATSKSQISFSSTGNNMMGCSFLPSLPSARLGTLKLWPGLSQEAHPSNRWEISALTANCLSL